MITGQRDWRIWAGIGLVVLGAVALAAELVPLPGFDLGHYLWPGFIILPGVALIVAGRLAEGASGLMIPGAIVTITGLVLAVQNAFDLWATWAYAWALVAPGGVGVGLWLQGWVRQSPALRAAGVRLVGLGLVLFAALAVFFEGLLHLSGFDFGPWGKLLVPAVLIVAGVALLVRRAFPTARRDGGEIAASR